MSANGSARSRRRKGQSERDQSCVRARDADKYGARFGGAETGSGRKFVGLTTTTRAPSAHAVRPSLKTKLRDIATLDAVVALYKGGSRVMPTQGFNPRLFDRREESVSCRRCRGGAEHRIRAGVQRRGIASAVRIRPVFAKQLSRISG